MTALRIGAGLWSQASDWPSLIAAAKRADELGYDHVWTWDHLYAVYGPTDQPIFEGHTALAAFAAVTSRARLGLLVGANTFRSPALATKAITTIDHISGGRAIMGIGGAWFEAEHRAFGLEFGAGFGERLDWLAEAVPVMRAMLDGETVTSEGGHYRFEELRQEPLPLQRHVPLMIGGSGERKTLPIVARWADMWNAYGSPEELAHKDAVLREHCAAVGRDPDEIERSVVCRIMIRETEAEARLALNKTLVNNGYSPSEAAADDSFWLGSAEQVAERMLRYRAIGFHTFVAELPAPYDAETLETMISVVRPMVADASDRPPIG